VTWKAKAPLYHDPSQCEFAPGETVPDAVVQDSPWLVTEGLVIDPDAKDVQQDEEPAEEAQPEEVAAEEEA
jgi:hypothetical protein